MFTLIHHTEAGNLIQLNEATQLQYTAAQQHEATASILPNNIDDAVSLVPVVVIILNFIIVHFKMFISSTLG